MALTTLNVRYIDPKIREKIHVRAHIRGMNIAEYLTNLVDFHDAMRAKADGGHKMIMAELESRGLASIRE